MAWTTATSEIKNSFPVSVIHGHVHPLDDMSVLVWVAVPLCVCVWECTFAPALWLMLDQCFCDPITGVWQGEVCVSVCLCVWMRVMERIIWGLFVSRILYHYGMLLSGQDHHITSLILTHTHAHGHTNTQDLSWYVCADIPLTARKHSIVLITTRTTPKTQFDILGNTLIRFLVRS